MGRIHYGDEGTIHRTGEVNVEVDTDGVVVGVWFRCMALPFTQSVVGDVRRAELKRMYEQNGAGKKIHAVDLEI